MEAIHAEEAGEVGHQAVVPLRLLHRLLSDILCVHRGDGWCGRLRPRLPCRHDIDASSPAEPASPLCG